MQQRDFDLLEQLGLPQALFDSGKISASVLSLAEKQTVFSPGDSCGAFLVLVSGTIRVDMTTRSGREVLLYRMQENDTCVITTSVLLNKEDYYARAMTETPVVAIAIPGTDFFTALTLSGQFAQTILHNYSQRMSALIQLLDKVATKDILFELCNCLLQHRDEHHIVYMTQDALATEIGTAREVVSRKLSVLENDKLLISKRGRIEILSLEEIEKMAQL